ncbi:MAG: VCBS repeat-containing protein [Polyangiaceae bacterium]|nr:VCBS repeat-containing protein [Polyangiaceae bacterium]MCB9610186.1 VCBS repeat-containing protein [Polyangiaceae bacterium]MCB9647681.1 VCBS repeat-containing protein [Deltaproteobacteria bacterium]
MNATGHPAPLRHLCAALVLVFGPLLAGCGGGGDSGGSNSTVEEVLADLGVDTTETPRVDEHGNPLGDEYAPMGDRSTVNRFAEVVAIGVPFDDDSQSQAAVMNLVPGASNTYAWDSPLQQPTDAELPWASATMRRAATYGDFDGDGLEELAVVYQTDGDVMLVRTDDAGASFAQSSATVIDNGTWTWLGVHSGDFDGDGRVDLVLGAIDATGAGVIKVLRNSGSGFEFGGLRHDFEPTTLGVDRLAIAVGNVDNDRAHEIAIAVNRGSTRSTGSGLTEVTSEYVVLDDATRDLAPLTTGRITQPVSNGTVDAAYTNLTLGDVDGDGLDELLLAGLNQVGGVGSSSYYDTFRYLVSVRDDGPSGFEEIAQGSAAVTLPDENFQPTSSGASQQLNHVVVAALDVDGDGAKEMLVGQHLFQSMRSTPGVLAPYQDHNGVARIPSEHYFGSEGTSGLTFNFAWNTVSVDVGDVTRDGRENLVLFSQRTGNVPRQVEVWGHDQIAGWTMMKAYAVQAGWSNVSPMHPQVLAPDIELDEGTAFLRYSAGSHRFVLTEPIIMAAIAAPPCARDLGQDISLCRASFGRAVSDSTSTIEDGTAVTAHIGVGFSAHDPLGANGLEVIASYERQTRKYTTNTYTTTRTLTYETGPLEDSVVLTVLPMDIYTYEILAHPDPTLVGRPIEVRIPRDVITMMTTVEFYNEHRLEGSRAIDSEIFAHTAGDPSTYPNLSERAELVASYTAIIGDEATTGQGQGRVLSTVSDYSATVDGSSYQQSGSLDVRATGLHVVVDIGVGYGRFNMLEKIDDAEEKIVQGAVANISAEAFAEGRYYNWGLFTYVKDDFGELPIEVVDFWVE